MAVSSVGRWFIFLAACLGVHWFFHTPPPNYSLIAMAVVAGLMALRAEMAGWERSCWAVVLIIFALIEIRAINHDNAVRDINQAAVLREERTHFGDIGEGIKAAIAESDRNFQSTMQGLSGVLNATAHADQMTQRPLNQMTGGDSYIYFDLMPRALGPFPMKTIPHLVMGVTTGPDEKPEAMVLDGISKINGKYPLHDVNANVISSAGLSEYDYGTLYPTSQHGKEIDIAIRPLDLIRQHALTRVYY